MSKKTVLSLCLAIMFFLPMSVLAKDVTLQWDASPEAVKYNVYIAEVQKAANKTLFSTAWQFNQTVDAPATSTVVVGLNDTKVFAYIVTAVNVLDEESFVSNIAMDRVVPGHVDNLRLP